MTGLQLLFSCTCIGIYTTTFLFAYLDENWRRLSRPRRTMTRAMARLPRIMWGRRFTLQRSFSSFQRRNWQPPSPPRLLKPPKRSPRLLKPPRPQTIMSLAWQWPGVRGSCQGLSQPGTSPAGWRWRAQPGTKESLITDIFVALHVPLARPAGLYQSRRWRPCPLRRARRISRREYWQVEGKTWAENESVRWYGRRSKRLWKMMEKEIEKKMGEDGRGDRRC